MPSTTTVTLMTVISTRNGHLATTKVMYIRAVLGMLPTACKTWTKILELQEVMVVWRDRC